MSVFKNIKGTIQSVQQDISTSIKSLTTSSKDKDVTVKKTKSHGVNLDAGADLLNRYQENWSELHQQAEDNASKAENLAVLIGSLFVRYSRQSDNLSQLKEEASTLPTILQQLQDLTNQIAKVEELCEQVEAAEIQLENICEVQEFNKAQTIHCQQLAAYKEKKRSDLEKFKVSLAQQHAKKIKSQDVKRQVQLKERQSIFQEAFDSDINYYRTFGHTERQPSVENDMAEEKLAEIQIEEDISVLDNFLESTDVTPSADRPPVTTHEEMPDDESDSGVINDRGESPDCVPSSLPYSENGAVKTGAGDTAQSDGEPDKQQQQQHGEVDKPVIEKDRQEISDQNTTAPETPNTEEMQQVLSCEGNGSEGLNSHGENVPTEPVSTDAKPDNLANELAQAQSLPTSTVKENTENLNETDKADTLS